MLAAARFGGPIGPIKLAFGSEPFSILETRGFPSADSGEQWEEEMRRHAELRAQGRIRMVVFYAVVGGVLFLGCVGLAIFALRVGHPDKPYLILILIACTALLLYAFSIRGEPFA